MGQCSTLPEARNSASTTRQDSAGMQRENSSSRQRLKEEGRAESLDFNKLTTLSNENMKVVDQRKLHVPVPPNSEYEFAKFPQMDMIQPQTRGPEQYTGTAAGPEPMEVDQRDVSQPISLPPPPEGAVRTRCYKLNLESELLSLNTAATKHQVCLGPFAEPPPPLTYSGTEDSSLDSATNVAIQTAQIFRGITVAKDGTILTQNARATRSNRGSKAKRGEKSRQAAKIDKAKDLVEDAISGKEVEGGDPPNMVSLVILGAYDDMKYLVRDGSKKLREAEGLPDETLLAVNRQRIGSPNIALPSPRQRIPPKMNDKPRSMPQSVPPKLKSNPKDRPKARRGEDNKQRRSFVPETCHDILHESPHGNNGEGDWRDALGLSRGFHSIWNCGGTEEAGTVSPTQVCSPKEGNKTHVMEVTPSPQHQQQPIFEGRESTLGHLREGELTARAN